MLTSVGSGYETKLSVPAPDPEICYGGGGGGVHQRGDNVFQQGGGAIRFGLYTVRKLGGGGGGCVQSAS